MKHPIRTIIIVALLVKCLYLIMGVIFGPQGIHSWSDILDLFSRNDTGWYKKIASWGYPLINHEDELYKKVDGRQIWGSSWAFFPAYPMLNRSLMLLFGCSFNSAAFTTAMVLSLLHFLLFFSFTRHFLNNDKLALQATILYILFPFHYHFSMFYTESLFLSALLMALIGVQQKKIWWSALALSVLVLTRPNGLVCLLPVWLYHLEQEGISLRVRNYKTIFRHSLFLILPVLAFAAYLYYQYEMTGYYNAFSIAQKGWGKSFVFPFKALFNGAGFEKQFNSVYVIIVMLYAIYVARKLPLSLNILIWINLLLPLTAGSTVSMSRYIAVLFPLFIILCMQVVPKIKNAYLLPIIFLLLQLWAFSYWLSADPFSY